MAIHMSRASDADLLEDFEEKVRPLVDFIKKHWSWKSFKPKGYDAYLKSKDLHTNITQDHYDDKHIGDFEGLDDSDTMGGGFAKRTVRHSVAFDHTDQGRDPLTVLMQSAVSWGCSLEREYIDRFAHIAEKKNAEKAKAFRLHVVGKMKDSINKQDSLSDDSKSRLKLMLNMLVEDVVVHSDTDYDMLMGIVALYAGEE